MSLLVVKPPALVPRGDPSSPAEWAYWLSRDGRAVDAEGVGEPASWPSADRVVCILDERDVAWFEVTLPKMPAHRVRAALGGLLEERLLDEPERTHLALGGRFERDAVESGPSGRRWVAAIHAEGLRRCLQVLQSAGRSPDSVVALTEPGDTWTAHARADGQGGAEAVISGALGVSIWPLEGSAGRGHWPEAEFRWTAEPAAAPILRDRFDRQAPLLTAAQRALLAAGNGTNLLQFELAPQMKASRLVAQAWAYLREPQGRALRLGLMALVAVQLIGLNAVAWRTEQELGARMRQTDALLQATFPGVKVVVDAPLQMQREVQALRQASGEASATDFETWLDVAAAATQAGPAAAAPGTPAATGTVRAVRWDAQGLVLEGPVPAGVRQSLTAHAARVGWTVVDQGTRLRVSPGTPTPTGATPR